MKSGKKVFQSLSVITQFGINMLVPIFMCSFLGIFIDKKCDTSYWTIILFFVGALAGFRSVYVLAKKIYSQKGDERNRDKGKNEK